MSKSKQNVVLLVFGKGGHTAQMERFLNAQTEAFENTRYIALTNADKINKRISDTFYCIEARDKYSSFKNIFYLLAYTFVSLFQMLRILASYNVIGVISTGPGMAVVPSVICRLLGKKVIFFESWSRVTERSMAGRVMYRIANVFFIQHKEMESLYPNAKYKGRL
ncbi:PssD/Cps14F family polysaccharide biosynthesis glycosyltransferase [Colwellia sp. MEBiC06753]